MAIMIYGCSAFEMGEMVFTTGCRKNPVFEALARVADAR